MILPDILKLLALIKDKTEDISLNTENEVVIQCNQTRLLSVSSFLFKELGYGLATVVALDDREKNRGFKIRYVYSCQERDLFFIVETGADDLFPSLTLTIPALNWYEREIRDMFGLNAPAHPDPRPLILHPENFPADLYPLRKDYPWDQRPKVQKYGTYEYKPVEGEGVCQIPVGPIHAGIIEPGHFHFSMAGEPILRLEIRHFWKHRGIEKLGEGKEPKELLRLTDKISGDHAFAHTLAYIQAVEKLSGTKIPERAKFIRVVFAELERLMCNLNDFAGIFQDVGYSFGAQGVFVLKEDLMRLNKRLSGNRFNKGVLKIGGIGKNLGNGEMTLLKTGLDEIRKGFLNYKKLLFNAPTVLERVEGTGRLKYETVKDLSCVGYTARASGLQADIRKAHPYLIYQKLDFKSATLTEGDVFARLKIRLYDIEDSFSIIEQCVSALPDGEIFASPNPVPANRWTLGYAEGQRGDIFHFVMTDKDGRISRWKVRDPSFANWQAIQFAVSGETIGDFPLVNKSLNLSYAGNDL